MRIVFDVNVYIAAALRRNYANELLRRANRGNFDLICSVYILEQIKEKLIEKFKFDPKKAEDFIIYLRKTAIITRITKKTRVIKDDPEDNQILDCALSSNANLIVSMDAHLWKLKVYKKIGIIHPKSLKYIIPE
jgi:putative PIN family toxin of toxin-antitoxin system